MGILPVDIADGYLKAQQSITAYGIGEKEYNITTFQQNISAVVAFHEFVVKNAALFFQEIHDSSKRQIKGGSLEDASWFDKTPKQCFAIAREITDRLSKLSDFFDDTKLVKDSDGNYSLKSTIKDSYGRDITLSYNFLATSIEEAEKVAHRYKEVMRGKGLKNFMAYWKMANNHKNMCYKEELIEIMKCSSKKRETCFSVKEKKDFWVITKILENTYLEISSRNKKEHRKRKIIRRPLLKISEYDKSDDESYPSSIVVDVFSSRDDASWAPTIYADSTLSLPSNHINLAQYIQNRASQRGKGTKSIEIDWSLLFDLTNQQRTAKSNLTNAKTRALAKLKKIEREGIIKGYSIHKGGVTILPYSQKKG